MSAQQQDDLKAQYLAATDSAAFIDVSDRTQFEMTGTDRHSFLHSFCTNDINGLPHGQGCEAFLCNAKGRLLGHIFVFASEDSLWIESVPGQSEALIGHLTKYHLLEDMQLSDRTEESAELLVIGPDSSNRLAEAGINVSEIDTWQHRNQTLNIDGDALAIHIKNVDVFGQPAFLITVSKENKSALIQRLLECSMVKAAESVLQSVRIEAGFPWYGVDLTEDNLAQEADRTSRAISFQKGCYLGQEPIARLNAMGHVNRELRSFVIESSEIPHAGTAVLNPKKEDKEAGQVTSVAWSWKHDKPVGLGMLRTLISAPGSEAPLATDPKVMIRVIDQETDNADA